MSIRKIINIAGTLFGAAIIIIIMVVGVSLVYKVGNRTCAERAAFDVGDSTLGAKGTYCKTWKQN